MGIKIERVTLRQIRMPLVHFFETSFGRTYERNIVLVEVVADGVSGWGEVTAGENPFYNEEWTDSAWLIVRDYVAPRVLKYELMGPEETASRTSHIRGHLMARGGVEAAVWDLAARQNGVSLAKQIGGRSRDEIGCGVSIGIQDSVPQLIKKIETEVNAGYQRIKMKIKPGWDVDVIREVRAAFPNIRLMADANSAYTLADADRLKKLDEFNLMMIEQPLSHDEIIDHVTLQAQLKTPICLDECIRSAHQAEQAIRMKACGIINIKLGRVGGFAEAKRVHDVAKSHGIPVWCGGMLESGIGRAHNIALSTLSNFVLPGDVSASKRYWARDIITPAVEVSAQGTIAVPTDPGFGYEIDHDFLNSVTEARGNGELSGFTGLLRSNRNYRFTWTGQVVSEVGDHYNNVAVFALALANTGSGLVVAGILISRAICAVLAGPIAGVLLDRMDRKRIMIISDLVRAAIAILFILGIPQGRTWLLYVLSGALMFASPFFSSGRGSILPTIATKHELHSANSLTQLTQWTTLTLGSFLGGTSVTQFGYRLAFFFNAMSFLFSAWCISQLHVDNGFRAERSDVSGDKVVRPWHEYTEGLRYMKSSPLILGIGLVAVGWATGGGAAQILFSVFGEVVFHRGPTGIGIIWGCAGIGLIIGALIAHRLGKTISFENYKRMISVCYVLHGGSYVLFSQARTFGWALFFIGLSRGAVAISSVLNVTQQLRHVSDEFRGRVFATIESWNWMTMMLSMAIAGLASTHVSPRVIGAWSGVFSSSTAIFWAWANWTGRLPEPELSGVDPDDIEVHDDPTV